MWPTGIKCTVAFTFDLDAESVWVSGNPANADKPGVLSQGRYATRVAVPLILELLERNRIPSTFFIIGKVAEEHPDTVKAIADSGHELAVHGYNHTSPTEQTLEEEEDSIVQTLSVLKGYGSKVIGYRSPSWEFSQHTLELLDKHHFAYSSNMMDDIRPYLHPGTSIVELPIHWILDDAPHFWFAKDTWNKKISTTSEVREIWGAEFEGIYELGGSFILTMHPQIIGRPSRLKMLDEFMTSMKSYAGVWFATCAEIAEQVKKHLS
ncbi:MAG: polysaccharide deacetylase [Anaerolineales bacterium]|nr:MAG: polysaccharide deacetylase [Anaerolineales bacterium]